jgi:hypothetical protein
VYAREKETPAWRSATASPRAAGTGGAAWFQALRAIFRAAGFVVV